MVSLLTCQSHSRTTYLASLDPGIGKTQALCSFLKAWQGLHFQPTGSALIAFATHDEIRSCIDRAGLDETSFAVLVAKDEPLGTQGLGTDRAAAPILFTTHEQIFRAAQRGRFEDQSLFHYRGAPRSLRVWDEAMLPARSFAVRLDDIAGLLSDLRPLAPKTAQELDALLQSLAGTEPGTQIVVPASIAMTGAALSTLSGPMADRWQDARALAGHAAIITRCNSRGVQLVGARDRLPDDFAPVLVLDASGRVRHTYRLQEEQQGNLVRLPAAVRSYGRLTVHHWDRGASRSTFEGSRYADERETILTAVAETINAGPADAEWLIVHHKGRSGSPDAVTDLRSRLDHPDRVHFLNWGRHLGTNEFREVRNVIILGLWHYSDAVYTGLALVASGGGEGLDVGREVLRDIAMGEHRHNLLQAICRASVRQGSGKESGDCAAYVIGRAGADTKALLSEVFPGCTIHDWKPVMAKGRGAALRVTEELVRRFAVPGAVEVLKADMREAAGLSSSQALAKVVRGAAVRDWMAANDITMGRHAFIRAA